MNSKAASLIVEALPEVQARLARAIEAAGPISNDHVLASSGLKDGHVIVSDYIKHGELGLAFEHVVYMITEPSLTVSMKCFELIVKSGTLLGYRADAWAEVQYET